MPALRTWDAGPNEKNKTDVNENGFESRIGQLVRALRSGEIGGDAHWC